MVVPTVTTMVGRGGIGKRQILRVHWPAKATEITCLKKQQQNNNKNKRNKYSQPVTNKREDVAPTPIGPCMGKQHRGPALCAQTECDPGASLHHHPCDRSHVPTGKLETRRGKVTCPRPHKETAERAWNLLVMLWLWVIWLCLTAWASSIQTSKYCLSASCKGV